MRNLVVLFVHFIAILARLLGPGGVRSVVAESLLLKHQLLIVNRSRQRSPSALARNDPGLLVKSDPRHTRGSADSGVRQERRDPPGCATDVAAVVN